MKNKIKKIYHFIEKIGSKILLEDFFRQRQLKLIHKLSEEIDSILELGVGTNSYFHTKERSYYITGFDMHEPSMAVAKQNGKIDNYIVGNVNKISDYFEEKSFDLLCAFDLIEHLPKENGYELISNMKRIARKRIIIYTPNGFLPQPPREDNPFQEHLSGWDYDEMKKLGFEVIGFNGYKRFRGMFALPKNRPYFIFNFISNISEIILHKINRDDLQYAILCYKDLNETESST